MKTSSINLIRRSTPYNYISYTYKDSDSNSHLEKIASFAKRLFQEAYYYCFNTAIFYANRLKLYQFEKKEMFFRPTLNQIQLISHSLFLYHLVPSLDQVTVAKNYWRTSYAKEHNSRILKKVSNFLPESQPAKLIVSCIRILKPFRLADICITAMESILILERSILGIKESRQLYKINKSIAIQSALAHASTLILILNKLHETINNPYYIRLSRCSRLDESDLEHLKADYIKNHQEDTFCPERAYIEKLDETCPEQAAQILNPSRHLEELTKRDIDKDFRKLMLRCHNDKNIDNRQSSEINTINVKINKAKKTLHEYFEK